MTETWLDVSVPDSWRKFDRIVTTWYYRFLQNVNVTEILSSMFPSRLRKVETWDFVLYTISDHTSKPIQITKLSKDLKWSKCPNWWKSPSNVTYPNYSKLPNCPKVESGLNGQTGENHKYISHIQTIPSELRVNSQRNNVFNIHAET